ncbi:hypothetical protein CRG98_021243 [Punica granatum]|uniref:Uncharacterized protein n=1 Tax=Punica granatum TaxID=22663 RepID=A0A2I0JPZ0_PUNGR|nr:hypothetical protein CRG98_021243 [Punica granatum]
MQDRGPIWGRNPMRGRSSKMGPKLDEGLKPKSGPEARCSKSGARARCGTEARCSKCGVGARCGAKARCGAGTQCSKCVLDKKVQEMRKESQC